MSVNKVFIVGNLGRDPENKATPNGLAISTFSVAVNELVKGEKKTEWVNVEVFGKQAENCQSMLHKGSQVHVEGKLRTKTWEDKQGQKRSTTSILADRVTFLNWSKPNYTPENKPLRNDSQNDFDSLFGGES